jgi:hypothetical protein
MPSELIGAAPSFLRLPGLIATGGPQRVQNISESMTQLTNT